MRLKEFFQDEGVQKVIAILVLLALIYSLRSIRNLILLTFIFSFIFNKINNMVYKFTNKVFPIKKTAINVLIYLLLIAGLVFFFYHYIPNLIKQLNDIVNQLSGFNLAHYKHRINSHIFKALSQINLESYVKAAGPNILPTLTDIGKAGLDVFLAFLMSFFLIMEKDKVKRLWKGLEHSKVFFLYRNYNQFFGSFINTFTKVMETQILIAFINSMLSMVFLTLFGFHQILGLGFMVFALGLIPVAGVIISLIPLSIIAFKLGGFVKVLYILGMVAVLHAFESYILNPKLMSMRTKLPVFFTFAVLIVFEQFMGVWGLLLGIPIFVFILDLLEIKV